MTASACGELDIVDHDALTAIPDGNTLSALERCGPLPEGIELIGGLRTAWAIDGVTVKDRDATVDHSTFRSGTSSLVLRLSDEGLECDDGLEPELLTCPAAWATDITLKKADPAPGLYALQNLAQGYSMATVEREGTQCQGQRTQGFFPEGQVEILRMDDECVVGRLIDTTDVLGDSGAAVEGGFVALRCEGLHVQ
ncbi:MAG: hypothetical protein AB1Z98_29845 [Nannocystaceae bacterium]